MARSTYRLDWTRPVSQPPQGEHSYHATDGSQHLLVILTDRQLDLAHALAMSMRERDSEILVQDAVEEAIATALHRRPGPSGELRLEDSDFE